MITAIMEETDARGSRRPQRDTHPGAPAAVFALLTDPGKILRWMGMEAQVEPHPGGIYLVKRQIRPVRTVLE